MRVSSISYNCYSNRCNSTVTRQKNISHNGSKGALIGSLVPATLIAGTAYLFGGENYVNVAYPAMITVGIFGGGFGHFYEQYKNKEKEKESLDNKK